MKYIPGYSFVKIIGSGKFGEVHLAQQTSTGQQVALKLLHNRVSQDPEKLAYSKSRFIKETEICAQLHHPHIVRLLDRGEHESQLYAAFEYIPGETLKTLLNKATLSAYECGELMAQVVDALATAHDAGIIHRDLSTNNIMVFNSGQKRYAKILDFGIGAIIPKVQPNAYETLNVNHQILGTPAYSSPEQLRGEMPTEKNDLYAWGLIFLECLTGQPVMSSSSLAEVYHQQLSMADIQLPTIINNHPLGDLLKSVLKKRKLEREGDARKVYTSLTSINLLDIVGELQQAPSPTETTIDSNITLTQDDISFKPILHNEIRQMTVVKCSFILSNSNDKGEMDLESYEALRKKQANTISDIIDHHGGYILEKFSNSVLACFGYPSVSDSDAKRAARAALKLIESGQKKNQSISNQHEIKIQTKVSIHSGDLLIAYNEEPAGIALEVATRLEQNAPIDSIIASENSKKLLIKFFEFEPFYCSNPISDSTRSLKTYLVLSEHNSGAVSSLQTHEVTPELIGRKEEFKDIVHHWKTVKNTEKLLAISINGEAGIGKSRLVKKVLDYVSLEDSYINVSRCLNEQRNNALFPILSNLRNQLRLNDSATHAAEKLTRLLQNNQCYSDDTLSVLCTWMQLKKPDNLPTTSLSPIQQKRILFDVLNTLLIRLAEGHTQLLIIEDLHWADPSTIEFIKFFCSHKEQKNVLLLYTTRRVSANDSLATHQIDLSSFTLEDTSRMIRVKLRSDFIAKHAIKQIFERTGGIPLFVEELTSMLLDENILVENKGRYQLTSSLEENSIPITLQDSLNERIEQLGKAKETILMASLIGQHFSYDMLCKVSARQASEIQQDLDKILASNLIYQRRDTNNSHYGFRHILIKQAVYKAMAKSVRQQYHKKIADILKSTSDTNTTHQNIILHSQALATHYQGAELYLEAIQLRIMLGQKLATFGAYIESAEQFEIALLLLEKKPGNDAGNLQQKIRTQLSPVLIAVHGWASRQVEFNMSKLHEISPNMEYCVQDIWAEFTNALTMHDIDRCQTLIVSIPLPGETELNPFTHTLMHALMCFYTGNFDQSIFLIDQAFFYCNNPHEETQQFHPDFGPDAQLFLFTHKAWAYFMVGREYEARELLEQVAHLSQVNPFLECLSLTFLGALSFYADWDDVLRNTADKGLSLSKDGGFTVLEGVWLAIHGQSEVENGDISTGLEAMQRGLGMQASLRHRLFACVYYARLALSQIEYASDFINAQKNIDKGLAHAQEALGGFFLPEYYLLQAMVDNHNGEYQSAQQQISDGLEISDQMNQNSGCNFFTKRFNYFSAKISEGNYAQPRQDRLHQ